VNSVVVGLSEAMRSRYAPYVVITGWEQPPPDHHWLRLPVPAGSFRSALGFAIRLVPNLLRLRRIIRGAVAVNPHFASLEILPLAVLRALRLSPTLVLSVHGADITLALQESGWKRSLSAWIFSSADLVVACSHALAAEVFLLSPKAKVAAVWNGVVPRVVDSRRPEAAPYIVCVAAFVKKKGHDVLLSAYRRIAQERPDLRLVLIGGEGPERPAVASTVGRLGLGDKVDVMVNLPNDEVWRWIAHAECFVLPSREEPFGIVLLEAAHTRTPVVATRVGGVPEFVTDGVHGLLCEPDQPEQLAEAVLATLADRAGAERRAHAFYDRAQEFTWSRAFERYRSKANLP
jgi:glycosyltransferase involved in cell wall biosynthesis